MVKTILGSCVSIIFHYRPYNLTAVSHAQLPSKSFSGLKCYEKCSVKCMNEKSDGKAFKYVDCVFDHMLEYFKNIKIPTNKIEVKLFGGGDILDFETDVISIGAKNVKKSLELIELNNLNLVSKRIREKNGQTLQVITENVEVYLSKVMNQKVK